MLDFSLSMRSIGFSLGKQESLRSIGNKCPNYRNSPNQKGTEKISNYIAIETTEFKSTYSDDVSIGVRVFDDYDTDYDNTWEFIPEDDIEILQKCVEKKVGEDILSHVFENHLGLYINDTYYEWEEIWSYL